MTIKMILPKILHDIMVLNSQTFYKYKDCDPLKCAHYQAVYILMLTCGD